MWTVKTLIRLGGCPGWSESSLGAHAILLVLSWGSSFVIVSWLLLPFSALFHLSSQVNVVGETLDVPRENTTQLLTAELLSHIPLHARYCHFHDLAPNSCPWWTGASKDEMFNSTEGSKFGQSKLSRLMKKPTKWLCAQGRLGSAWASALSDQSLRCLHEETLGP